MKSFKNLRKKIVITTATLATIIGLQSKISNSQNKSEIKDIYLTSCVNNGVCSTESKDVLLEDKVKLNLVIEADSEGKNVYFSDSKNLNINGKKIEPSFIKSWGDKNHKIKWYKVEPQKNDYNNGSNGNFHWDTPDYKESLIDDKNNWIISADAHPTDPSIDINNGLGTMRYKVEFIQNGKKLETAGKESKDLQGIKNNVHRISFRKDNSYLGWLTSLFNLPYIYGSSGKTNEDHQTERYIGADCADLIIAAYRKLGNNIPYTYTGGLFDYADKIIDEKNLFTDGENYYNNQKLLKYGKDVKIGDLIIFGRWHTGAIAEDRSNPKGKYKGKADSILNKYDLMIHTLFDVPEKINIDGYGGFSILRWKDKK
jgi:hypothetical protein